MLLAQFDKPVYAQRRYFVQEITGLDDVFDFLDEPIAPSIIPISPEIISEGSDIKKPAQMQAAVVR